MGRNHSTPAPDARPTYEVVEVYGSVVTLHQLNEPTMMTLEIHGKTQGMEFLYHGNSVMLTIDNRRHGMRGRIQQVIEIRDVTPMHPEV